mmetsp:Transcript_24309/g.76574  ORF Transcript_24309/g.76574 Transcript_24309/m.76574 type:complete len:253 (+) Transcript_24309:409-1167(+)
MPTLPLRMLSRNTVVGGAFWNASIALARWLRGMEPVTVRYWKPSSVSRCLSHSRVTWYCENTRALLPGSSSRIFRSSASSTCSLDSHLRAPPRGPGLASLFSFSTPASLSSSTSASSFTAGTAAGARAAGLHTARHVGQRPSPSPLARAEYSSAPRMHSWQNQCLHGVLMGFSSASRQIPHSDESISSGSGTGAAFPTGPAPPAPPAMPSWPAAEAARVTPRASKKALPTSTALPRSEWPACPARWHGAWGT